MHEDGTLELSLGIWKRKRQQPLVVKIDKEQIPNGQVKEIELVYDRGLWLCLSYEDGKEPKENKNQNRVAIDPGEIHTIAAVCENGESLIITGRKIRSIHRLFQVTPKRYIRKFISNIIFQRFKTTLD